MNSAINSATTSMTSFARREFNHMTGRIIWEIRTVNHRYLDIHLRLPDQMRQLETPSRKYIAAKLSRGRVDAVLKYEQSSDYSAEIKLNPRVLDALVGLNDHFKRRLPSIHAFTAGDLLSFPGILITTETDLSETMEQAESLLDTTLDEVVANRRREGLKIKDMITTRIESCRNLMIKLKSLLPEIEKMVQQRWRDRLASLEENLDSSRMYQEMTLLLTKIDVSEEIDRLTTHLDETERVIKKEHPVGRRLDFIMQELNREVNTMSAKSADKRLTEITLELKVLIEQMREQVQNLE